MKAYVGLGANLGDARATLLEAIGALSQLQDTVVLARSSIYRSAPVDAVGPDFYNAVALLDTSLEPMPLLRALQRIEQHHGRERPYVNAPRTLDLDLLLCDDRVLDEPALVVPHPRMQGRAFVLAPLLEVAPEVRHPVLGALQPWLERITSQAIEKLP